MRTKPLIQLGLLFMAIMAITACGTMQNYQTAMNTWNGAPANALEHEWGTPIETTHLKNGNELLTYRVVEHEEPVARTYANNAGLTRISPQGNEGMLSHSPKMMPGHSESFWCETQFEVNRAGMIVNSHFEGNNCVASKMKVRELAFAH